MAVGPEGVFVVENGFHRTGHKMDIGHRKDSPLRS